MIKLIDKQKIILMHVNEGKSQRQISRELKIDRKTIRRYLREYEQKKAALLSKTTGCGDNSVLISDICQEPKYKAQNRKKIKLTDEIIEKIRFYLKENQEKRATGRSKQAKKKIDIYDALVEERFDIGYTTVCTAVSRLQRVQKEAYIRQEYPFGRLAEFDWGEVKLKIAGKLSVFQMSAFTAAKSNYRYADIYHNQKTESFLDTHANFFEEVGGVYSEIVYDNTKVAVARFVGPNERQATKELLKLSIYYGFCFRFANIDRPNEKGHVERSVEYVRRRVFSKRDEFSSVDEARSYLGSELKKLNLKPQVLADGRCAVDILEDERGYLLPKPPRYDSARISEPRVNKYCCIAVDNCYYSVPDDLVGCFVLTKIYPDKIICFYDGKRVAYHDRIYGKNRWKIDIAHFMRSLKSKPGALASSVALSQMEPRLFQIYHKYYRGSERSFIELIELAGKIGLERVEAAIAELEDIDPNGITTDKIITICQRVNYPPKDEITTKCQEIEMSSRQILSMYAQLLNGKDLIFEEVRA